jgi:hypothetical protein
MNGPSDRWVHWQVLAFVAGVYGLSFLLPAARIPVRMGPTLIGGKMADPGGERLAPVRLSGADAFRLSIDSDTMVIAWLANPVLWLGIALLALRRWLLAGLAGVAAFALASVAYLLPLGDPDRADYLIGYWLWLASMVLLAAFGLFGCWRWGRQLPNTYMPL